MWDKLINKFWEKLGRDSGREYRREIGRGIGRDGQTKHFPNFQPKGRPEAKFSSVGPSGIQKFIMVADFNFKRKIYDF